MSGMPKDRLVTRAEETGSGNETGRMEIFEANKLYLAGDPALSVLGSPSTLAHWRSQGRGPAFIKLGSRVAYRGSALNQWLAARTVRPTDDGPGLLRGHPAHDRNAARPHVHRQGR